jgi:hypothetical protein
MVKMPSGVSTVMSARPALPVGAVTVIEVELIAVTLPSELLKLTFKVSPATAGFEKTPEKFEPEIVTEVPAGPAAGLTCVRVGEPAAKALPLGLITASVLSSRAKIAIHANFDLPCWVKLLVIA